MPPPRQFRKSVTLSFSPATVFVVYHVVLLFLSVWQMVTFGHAVWEARGAAKGDVPVGLTLALVYNVGLVILVLFQLSLAHSGLVKVAHDLFGYTLFLTLGGYMVRDFPGGLKTKIIAGVIQVVLFDGFIGELVYAFSRRSDALNHSIGELSRGFISLPSEERASLTPP